MANRHRSSEETLKKAHKFFKYILKHTADDWYGKPFNLAPWQADAIDYIFGNLDEYGRRETEMVYLEVPKKSGKSEFAAGIALLLLALDKRPGTQIYGAAAAQKQALNVYRAACKMVEQSPHLTSLFRVLRGTNRILKYDDPDSFYAAVAADGDLGDGVNPSCVIADEIHRWKDRKAMENWDVLTKGGITRRETLTVAITTAGVITDSPLAWMLHEKTERIQKGIVQDRKFYGRIYGATKEDDPSLESTWIKANPSLVENGGFLPLSKIRAQYETAVSEGDLTSFKRYFLNIWDQKEDLAIDIGQWDKSAGDWQAEGLLPNPGPIVINGKTIERKVRPFRDDYIKQFVGRRCWAGVDLSMSIDFSAVAFVFEGRQSDTYDVLPFFWIPEQNLRKRQVQLGVPLQRWADHGFLEIAPGDVIDYHDVKARLEWGAQLFDLQEICWDPWNSRQISTQMIDEGYRCIEIRQGYGSLSEPTKKMLELVANGALHHGGHPVLKWQASCAATMTDGRDNIMFTKPDRDKTNARIDGISAIVDALARAIIAPKPFTYKVEIV